MLNANGNRIERQVDLTNDGTIDQKTIYTKSPNDGELSTTNYLLDNQQNTHETSKYVYLLDENGRSSARIEYLAGSNTPSNVEVYERDGLGRIVTTYRDNNADGNLVTLGSDSDGNPIITQINGAKNLAGHYTFTNTTLLLINIMMNTIV